MGFVLFTWMKIRRGIWSVASNERLPSFPPIGICAMSCALLPFESTALSSFSDQKVPSKKTQSAEKSH